MKKLSEEEFENAIKRLINGEITKVKLAKELETDPRTLDNKIQEVSVTNPKLYNEYIRTLPYKQKGIDHIDYEALVIYMLKKGLTADEAAQKFEISRRTVSRRICELENKELLNMYREVADNRKHRRNNGIELNRKISELEYRDVVIGGVNDRRKAELLAIEARFNKLCETMDKGQAAKVMGYGDRDRVYKLLNELYKLEIEEYTQKANEEQIQAAKHAETNKTINTKQKEEITKNETPTEETKKQAKHEERRTRPDLDDEGR